MAAWTWGSPSPLPSPMLIPAQVAVWKHTHSSLAVAHVDAQRRGQEQDRRTGSLSAKFPSLQQ